MVRQFSNAQEGRLQVRLSSHAPIALQVDFDCAAGELVALVGPSGSGKTTVLRTIAGLHRADGMQGEVTVGGQIWFAHAPAICLAPQARRVGMVFQQYALFPHLTALQNIAINNHPTLTLGKFSVNSAQNKLSKPAQQLAALMARLGLSDLVQRLPGQLSGGQQQRVALARALWRLTTQSGVLLLDEPFSAVDAPTRQTLYTELASLRQHIAVPMVLVTHDLAEARRLADRVVIIDAGQSLQSGTPAQVFGSPRNARVAQLVGIQNHFSGVFYRNVSVQSSFVATDNGAPAASAYGVLKWGGTHLRVVDKGKIADNTAVTWVLAAQHIEISRTGANHGEAARDFKAGLDEDGEKAAPNRLRCTLVQRLELGEMCVCQLQVEQAGLVHAPLQTTDAIPMQAGNQVLNLNLSTSFLRALQADVGTQLDVLIPPQAVHIMPLKT